MLKTWTDTHYKLDESDWLYIAKHDLEGSASLVCPGYARDGQGFSIHFTSAHIEMLEQLVEVLRAQLAQPVAAELEYRVPAIADAPKYKSAARPGCESSDRIEVGGDRQLVYPVGREK